ncbi:MAG: ribosome recycling factor [Bacillota bacterium]|nr:ribosome recycling factor [Bacillota bacterium]
MAIEITRSWYRSYENRMQKSIDYLGEEFNAIRAGRANPRVLDRISVPYYGTDTPLNQVAAIQVPEPRLLAITPWDPTLLRDIERALQASDLGINPTNDGKTIRLVFPPLTEERRRDLVRQVQKLGEEAKVAIRNVRRECMSELQGYLRRREIGEDNLKDAEGEVQKITDRATERVDQLVAEKEKDLMDI